MLEFYELLLGGIVIESDLRIPGIWSCRGIGWFRIIEFVDSTVNNKDCQEQVI